MLCLLSTAIYIAHFSPLSLSPSLSCNPDESSTMTHCKFRHKALLEAVIQMDLEIRRKHCGSSEEGRAL